ncbi:hypothetical protein [Alkalibacter mobilis]|uniref:hypothetical protein n=1 Tax=Alkalibacter mobilis TaxID=2787712 RepID=UPI00189FF264|nr:hypothetical protein [Alkalibacter mobilis]MBF7097588.1 hypothetical protein [Alkalibacter mobilis]
MFFIGDNNSREVGQETVDDYINSVHRPSSIYGLAKGNMFWAKDITFGSPEVAWSYIKAFETKGFKVYHNISIEDELLVSDVQVSEVESEAIDEEVKSVEKVERKRTSRSRRKE